MSSVQGRGRQVCKVHITNRIVDLGLAPELPIVQGLAVERNDDGDGTTCLWINGRVGKVGGFSEI
jgi:hypothetical protein